jgi:hypothetical protein
MFIFFPFAHRGLSLSLIYTQNYITDSLIMWESISPICGLETGRSEHRDGYYTMARRREEVKCEARGYLPCIEVKKDLLQ